jgi:zinc protease
MPVSSRRRAASHAVRASATAALFASAFLPVAQAQDAPAKIPVRSTPLRVDTTSSTPLPRDPKIIVGTLPNGIRYYVRSNAKPEKRAELRLVINAGSILEDDDQRGLAHFLEHMAFNGTARFPKNQLVSYLESVGMRFGPDINASTSFDETIYELQIPTDSSSIEGKAFDILEDWARGITLDTTEIAKERGVVIEEWRLGRGADARMADKQLPILLKGSRYADRLPIGLKTTLETFKPASLERFYADWYRPDLMAVMAVGDFDPKQIEKLIKDHFSDVPAKPNGRQRAKYGVPDQDSTLVAIATDKEAEYTTASIYFKMPHRQSNTVGGYKLDLTESLFSMMLNDRLDEIRQKPDAPFIGAGGGKSNFLGDRDAFTLTAFVPDGGVLRGLDAVLAEAVRLQKHGFTATELARAKQNLLRSYERTYAERDKRQSANLIGEYIRNFLNNESIPGIEFEYPLAQRLIPAITLADVNRLTGQWLSSKNRVIAVNAPEKAGVTVPSEGQLLAVFDSVTSRDLAAYNDGSALRPLVSRKPKAATIVTRSTVPEIGVTNWTLSNGVRVILKPTDFKADEVLILGSSPGGSSRLSRAEFPLAREATTLVTEGGVGAFNQIELQKALAGKAASAAPGIGELTEFISGRGSPKDIETAFQLMYLYFTQPRPDSTAVVALKQRFRAALANRGVSPEEAFSDTLSVTLSNHHPRSAPITVATVDSLDLGASLEFYQDRFADASDFTFVIVGNFTVQGIQPLVLTWLGGLPSIQRKETFGDVGMHTPEGVEKRDVRRGTEPKARTTIVFNGPFEWTRDNRYALASLAEVLRMRLRDVLREELGGTYGVSVSQSSERDPRQEFQFVIDFGSSPEKADTLRAAVFEELHKIKKDGPTAEEIEKVREMQRRSEETEMRQNGFWLNALASAARYNQDPKMILRRGELRASLTQAMVRDIAAKYLSESRYVQVRLLPEQ